MDLKNENSPGLDRIPAELFKVASDKSLPYFEILFNKFSMIHFLDFEKAFGRVDRNALWNK